MGDRNTFAMWFVLFGGREVVGGSILSAKYIRSNFEVTKTKDNIKIVAITKPTKKTPLFWMVTLRKTSLPYMDKKLLMICKIMGPRMDRVITAVNPKTSPVKKYMGKLAKDKCIMEKHNADIITALTLPIDLYSERIIPLNKISSDMAGTITKDRIISNAPGFVPSKDTDSKYPDRPVT